MLGADSASRRSDHLTRASDLEQCIAICCHTCAYISAYWCTLVCHIRDAPTAMPERARPIDAQIEDAHSGREATCSCSTLVAGALRTRWCDEKLQRHAHLQQEVLVCADSGHIDCCCGAILVEVNALRDQREGCMLGQVHTTTICICNLVCLTFGMPWHEQTSTACAMWAQLTARTGPAVVSRLVQQHARPV